MKETRAGKAGKKMAESIIEMVHLMYQNNTARLYLRGLVLTLQKEQDKRSAKAFRNKKK